MKQQHIQPIAYCPLGQGEGSTVNLIKNEAIQEIAHRYDKTTA